MSERIGEDFIDCTSAGTVFISQDHQMAPVITWADAIATLGLHIIRKGDY